MFSISDGNDAWIGFNDIQDESLFQWSTGQQVKYTNWNLNAPRQAANTDEDCVVMTNNVTRTIFIVNNLECPFHSASSEVKPLFKIRIAYGM